MSLLLTIDGKRQKYIPRLPARGGITRVSEDHPIGDDGARPVERTAPCFHAVHRLITPDRVEIPDNRAVGGGISAQMPVDGTREGRARHRADSRRLCGTTSLPLAASGCRRV